MRITGRITLTAALPASDTTAASTLDLTDGTKTVSFPRAVTVPMALTFQPPLTDTGVLQLSFTNPSADCVFKSSSANAADTLAKDLILAASTSEILFLITCLHPASDPPRIIAVFTEESHVYYDRLESSRLQTKGELRLTVNNKTTTSYLSFVVRETYIVTGEFVPTPKLLQSVPITQITTPGDCVFLLNDGASLYTREPVFKQKSLTEPLYARMVCRRTHNVGSILSITNAAYAGEVFGPMPVWGLTGMDFFVPANIVGASREITDVLSRDKFETIAVPSGAAELPTPYVLRVPATNVTRVRVRVIPSVLALTVIHVTFTKTNGLCGFTTYSESGNATFAYTAQLTYAVGDAQKDIYVSCSVTNSDPVYLHAELAAGNYLLPSISLPLKVRGSIKFTTEGVEPRLAFNGDLVANRDWRFTVSLDPVAADVTTIVMDVLPKNATGPNPACGFRLITGELVDEHLTYGAFAFNFTFTMTLLDLIVNCRVMTENNPSVITITNSANNWYDRFITAPFRVRGAMWLEDAALPPFETYPTSSTVTLSRVAVQNIHKFNLRVLPAPVAPSPVLITVSDPACTLGLASNMLPATFTAAVSLSVPIGVENMTLHLYCTQPLENVALTTAPTGQSFLGVYVTNPFSVENRFNMATLPTGIHVLEPTLLTFTTLPVEAIVGVGQFVHVNITVDSNFTKCYGALVNSITGGVPESNSWQPLYTTGLELTAIRTTSRSFWFKCLFYTHPLGADPTEGGVLPRINITLLSGDPFMSYLSEPIQITLIDCKAMPTINQGAITYEDNGFGLTHYTAEASVVCVFGYALTTVGQPNVTCTLNTASSPPISNCVQRITCLASGWSAPPPACGVFNCGPVPPAFPDFGTQPVLVQAAPEGNATAFGSRYEYGCVQGFMLTASPIVICTAGGWSVSSAPACVPLECPQLALANNVGEITYSAQPYGERKYQSTAIHVCLDQYERTSGDLHRVCRANQTWSGVTPICRSNTCVRIYTDITTMKPISFTRYGLPIDFNPLTNAYPIDTIATYACADGFMWTADSLVTTRQCVIAEGWQPVDTPRCVPRPCPTLTEVTLGSFTQTPTTLMNAYGVTATYFCDYGAVMSHSEASITCTAKGDRSSSPRTCSPYNCGIPSSINGATIVVSNNGNHGPYLNTSWVEYRCNAGYNLRYAEYNLTDGTGYVVEIIQSNVRVLAARRECTPRGWFPLAAPQCQINQCESLFVPANGISVTYRDALNTGNNGGIPLSYGTIATYSCQPGYETRDAFTDAVIASTRRCGTLAEGWVPALAPVCSAIDWGQLNLTGPIKYGLPVTYNFDTFYVSGPTRFQSRAVYKCQSGFTFTDGSSVFERRCAETGAWLPAEPSCQDIDECDPMFFGGRYFVDCAALYGSQSKCINTFGSYVCTPFITLEDPPVNVPSFVGYVAYNADTREIVPDSAKGGQTVQLTLRAGANVAAPYITRVQYTNPNQNLYSNPELLTYECSNIIVKPVPDLNPNAASDANLFLKVKCTLSAGQGGDLYLRMQFCVQRNSATNLAGDIDCTMWNWNWAGTEALDDLARIGDNNRVRISYPLHHFVPSSLHTVTAAGSGQRTDNYVSMTTLGEDIGFEISNLYLERKEILMIRYGLASSTTDFPFECVFNSELSRYQGSPNILVCRTQDNVNRVDLYFKLTIAGRIVYSTDRYSYPQVPTVETVYGCGVDNILLGNTAGCPTDGGDVRLTVTGTGFLEPLSVMVSGRQCTAIDKISNELLTCKLPIGSGSSLALIVKAGSQRTESRNRITYSIPVITEIYGCQQISTKIIKECNRFGGNRIMLHGDNFGASGATISIGGLTCTNVTHTATNPHREVLCTTPADASVDRAVTLLQRYGNMSRETILLSYVQCPPGQRNNDYHCVNCEPGYYNDLWSQALCRQCQPGYYSNTTGAASCSPCPTGTYSGLGYQECVRCPRGTFSQERAEACMQCAPGTYAASEGSAQCEACPLGAEHTSDYSYCQCKVGSYKDARGVCQTCMLGGNCLNAGTTVYNVVSLDYYSPSVTFKNLTSVVRFSFPVRVNANVPANDARRNALALAMKALFDDTDWRRGRFVFVSADLDPTIVTNNSMVQPTTVAVSAANADLVSVYIITIDVVPPEHDDEEEASQLVASAVLHLNAANTVLSQELAFVNEPTVQSSYYRHAITSFEYCLSNTCQPGNQCAEGHTGPLCSVCLPGYGKDSVFKCGRCNDPALAWFILIAGALAAIIGCGILAWKQITDGKQSMNELPAPAVPLLFKVAMAGLQVMSIASRYDLKWPGFLDGLFDGADTAAGVGTAMLSLDCFLGDNPSMKPFWVTSIGIMALPLFGVILPLLFFAPRYFSVKRGYKKFVLAEVAEQRRLMVEIVTQFESFQRQRDKATVVQDRAAQRVQNENELKVSLWDHVADEDNLGILAGRKTEATLGIENDVHTGINLDIKQSAQSELEHARKTRGTRRQRRTPNPRLQRTESELTLLARINVENKNDLSNGLYPLAPPEQPPMPAFLKRRSLSSIGNGPIAGSLLSATLGPDDVESRNAFFGVGDVQPRPTVVSPLRRSTNAGIARQQLVGRKQSRNSSPALGALEARRVIAADAEAATTGSGRVALSISETHSPVIRPYQFNLATAQLPRNESFPNVLRAPSSNGTPEFPALALSGRNGSATDSVPNQDNSQFQFEINELFDSESDYDAACMDSAAANEKCVDQGSREAEAIAKAQKFAVLAAACNRRLIETIENDATRWEVNQFADTVDNDDPLVVAPATKHVGHALDDTAFVFLRDIICDYSVSEAALASAYSTSGESREAIFERTAREVEMYGIIVKNNNAFDDQKRSHNEANASTTEEFAKIVQSEYDLDNMRLLSRLSFDTLYNAELLRERVLRRERAFQRVRADAQVAWYVHSYGEKNGKAMFEKERAKRLKSEPPKVTAAEMRVRVSVAESLYNQILSEFFGYVITTITVVMFMIHPNLTRQFFNVLSCKNIGGTVDPSTKVVLGEMMEICYSSQHILFIAALGMPMLILWVLGIPFFAWFVLYRNRNLVMMPVQGASAVMRNKKKVFESQMAFLYRGYKPSRYYWFLMEMARKVIIVAISVFFPGALHTQLMLASMLIFVCIIGQIAAKPFENKIPEFVELFSLFTSFMIFFLANFLFVSTVGDTAQTVVTVLICMLVVAFIAIVVVAFQMLSKEEAQLTPLRNALREAHAQGQESGPVVRAWRIEMARAHQARIDKASIVSTTAGVKATTARAVDAASAFTFTTGGTNKHSTEANMMRTLQDDARADVTTVTSERADTADATADSRQDNEMTEVLTEAQRGARIALMLEQGCDVTTTALGTTVDATQSAVEVSAAVIADAKKYAQAQAKIAGDKLDIDLTPG